MHWVYILNGRVTRLLNMLNQGRSALQAADNAFRLSRGWPARLSSTLSSWYMNLCSCCCRLLGLPRAAWRTSSCLRLSREVTHLRPCLPRCQKLACTLRLGCSRRVSPAALAWLRLAVGVLPSRQLQSRGRLAGMEGQRCERPTPSGQALPQHLLQLVQHGLSTLGPTYQQLCAAIPPFFQRLWLWQPTNL